MDWLRRVLADVREVWSHSNAQTRATLIASALLVCAILVGLAYLQAVVSKPSLVPAMTRLDPGNAAEIVQHLRSRGIPAQTGKDQHSVYVPEGMEGEAAAEALIGGVAPRGPGSGISWDIFETQTIGMTRQKHRLYFARALETQLAKHLKGSHSIRDVVVNLAIPETQGLFEDDKPTASVMVDAVGLSQGQVRGIQNLVARAVPGMAPEGVTVTDYDLNPLSEMTSITGTSDAEQRFNFTTMAENYYAAKIIKQLADAVGGRSNIRASVTLMMDWERIDSEIRRNVDPVPEEKSSTSETTTESRGGAEPGAAANIPDLARSSATSTISVTRSRETSDQKFAFTVENLLKRGAQGSYLKSPPAAVITVNQTFTDYEDEEHEVDEAARRSIRNVVEGILMPLMPEPGEGATVASATAPRIVVEAMPFLVARTVEGPPARWAFLDYLGMVRPYIPTILIVVIFGIAWLQIRKIIRSAPITLTPRSEEESMEPETPSRELSLAELGIRSPEDISGLPPEEQRRIKLSMQLNEWSMTNPEKVANIIKTWLHD